MLYNICYINNKRSVKRYAYAKTTNYKGNDIGNSV